jgi:hypothetical protein
VLHNWTADVPVEQICQWPKLQSKLPFVLAAGELAASPRANQGASAHHGGLQHRLRVLYMLLRSWSGKHLEFRINQVPQRVEELPNAMLHVHDN